MVLAEVGMAIVRVIRKALDGHGSGRLAGDLPLGTFCLLVGIQARVSRLVHLAIVLHERLDHPPISGNAGAVEKKSPPETDRPERSERLERLERLETSAAETLNGTLRPKFSKAFLNRPMEDLIGLICKGLGLDPAWVESAIGPEAAPDFVQVAEVCLNVLAGRARWGLRERSPRHPPDLRQLALRLLPAAASP